MKTKLLTKALALLDEVSDAGRTEDLDLARLHTIRALNASLRDDRAMAHAAATTGKGRTPVMFAAADAGV